MNGVGSVSFRHGPLPEGDVARRQVQGGAGRNAVVGRGLEFFRRAYLVNILVIGVPGDREAILQPIDEERIFRPPFSVHRW